MSSDRNTPGGEELENPDDDIPKQPLNVQVQPIVSDLTKWETWIQI